MVDAGAVGIAAYDPALFVNSIERSKRRAWNIIDDETIWRNKDDAVRRTGRVAIAAHDQIHVVVTEKNCARRTHWIERRDKGAIAVTKKPMRHPEGIYVIAAALF